ncbi:MAG: CoA transferase [Alicyclobacillus macrosporangiidus]|uniref:CaiB/BaiF CoA transferase family protein n=1 Tax=Alicyclobacillus macrosporangiidus TaxID=392015 RepID=UPI0026EAC04D|nr:CoA transferase [Alicyclobacillus macrosporangiidus]MCL6599558.1 CoA transferase [Alicyclobacillus macrosporangiidus]
MEELAITRVKRPLEGIRVIELGSVVAGPFAARVLADFGAEVIKIEPKTGDPLRTWGRLSPAGWSWWWYAQARNKRLMVVDLHQPDGQAIVQALMARSDAVIENFRPGTLDRWHLGYEDAKKLNPAIVYASISGFGQSGPYRDRPGFGNIAESMSGMRYVTGYPDRPPVRVGFAIGDEIAALYTVIGILMSLLRRERARDGQGDRVDVALTEAVFSLTEAALTEYLHEGVVQERTGNQLTRSAPSNIYPTRDGRWVAIGANTDHIFPRLLQAMDRADLAGDSRFSDNQSRVQNVAELDAIISAWTAQYDAVELLALLNQHDVPAGPVMSVADIAIDPQYEARDMILRVPADTGEEIGMPGVVPKLANHPGRVDRAGGRLGRDTDAILQEVLGWTAEQIQEARRKGVIA